jgi:hypothetical protein
LTKHLGRLTERRGEMENRTPATRKSHRNFAKPKVLYFVVACLLLPCATHGQARQIQPGEVADSIARVKSGDFLPVAVEQIARAHAVQAIPTLKERFALSQDANSKGKIADALVRLGDTDDTYWNYLIDQATEAVKSDVPLPTMYDSHGAVVKGQASPEFTAWTKAHGVSPESAAEDVVFRLPGKVAFLAETGDSRGIPLLRQALQSHNFLIATMAAKGLALIQDKDSIPLIVEACKRAPAGAASAIADSLIYFDDSQAQSAADTYLTREYAQAMRDARTRGKRPFGY